ncbi:IS256 family transposase [Globicatella sulfidifaciens]|uniref:Mutator family transposase n=1 Tax=Globicatella sulfidifaciens TaxID=136093 RepID=A0A7X8H028_9LACT|nr:IS256 family transposase [Globicatella sulfidifaciens]NLJ18429.1 IS256 family transposase [Globicatella sulfidifaciens]
MTQIHFTLDTNELQELISNSGADDASKLILTKFFNQLMENQRDEYCNVSPYERDEKRISQRNGYYERELTTRVGTLTLNVPRTRDGAFSTDIFERYQRNEKALVTAMLEMYVTGVSTRKVGKIVETLCGKHVSKSYVSSITKILDKDVEEFRTRRIDKEIPYLMTDVIYIKVREERRVVSKAVHIAIGVDSKGFKNILGFMISESETEETWSTFYQSMIDRGLSKVLMVISDAHKGQVNAIQKTFTDSVWQRCQVHFMRNVMTKLPKKNTQAVRTDIKNLFKINDIDAARIAKENIIKEYEASYPNMCTCLDDGFEESFQYTASEKTRYNRLKSTNLLERLNGEIRRREKVIRIFPNVESATRLIGAILKDMDEEWVTSTRRYIEYTHTNE